MKRLERALVALQGLWVGDAFGSHFEFEHVDWHRPRRTFESRQLPPATWRYTDDTQMALSVYETLRDFEAIIPNKLAESFSSHFDISRGYGLGAEQLILDIQAGGDWATLAPAMFDGTGSYGNGSAMRIAPIGAYFADDFHAVVENAKQSSIVTHTHPDGVAGAISVAIGVAQVSRFKFNHIEPDVATYWNTLIEYTPSGKLNEQLQVASALNDETPTAQAAKILGCGWDISAVDTVPFALWCAITHLPSYEEALWHTISVGGDADTTGAMVGGIVASYGGKDCIPKTWEERCELLPHWIYKDKNGE